MKRIVVGDVVLLEEPGKLPYGPAPRGESVTQCDVF